MNSEISEKDLETLVKMALFQTAVMRHIPQEVIHKAIKDAVIAGDISEENFPTPKEVEELAERFDMPLGKDSIN
ncbi:MAG TPA: hypothetical protein H9961_06610 [Candidatus Duodenibacillus intestinavium]|nr:hypothetical protein [Candidatus Duodenibacillus intestinavium]